MIHALKTEPVHFEASAAGIKGFEVRKNDRPYSPGDYVALNEWNGEGYTGKCTLHKIVFKTMQIKARRFPFGIMPRYFYIRRRAHGVNEVLQQNRLQSFSTAGR